jgi:hypothetical protein
MYDAFQQEIARLVTWVKTKQFVEERQVLWCLSHLPAAYRELTQTYESRFADAIVGHQQAALARVSTERGPGAALLAVNLRGKLQSLNERFGLRALPPPSMHAPKLKPTRKGKVQPTSE